ncbi:feruloyl-CoA synthase [Chryseolinea serpens]|uniref:Feruloyl-CoA synthase n=1 Tax=Chryseolinea serpens TaxID=947013 RepID=A0A1M5TCT9_9BACT|nr:feruloyl-CoA synthase [Chryseolinea serpens]SHH48532.1 feruloyl-CoA synthase [Chryseolinea serpens]
MDIKKQSRKDNTTVLYSAIPLEPHPYRLTERLEHWAMNAPGRIFIGKKNASGGWDTLTYRETFSKVKSISQAILERKISASRPIAILSENSIEHALIALAALHVGVPYSPIAPAYSLRSTDFEKLKYVVTLLTPGMFFVSDGIKYEKALRAVANDVEVVSPVKPNGSFTFTAFDELLSTKPTPEVEAANAAIQPDTVAKILFTSGSTGLPKGVINTHENISTNWQQITQTFPFLEEEGLEFIDWLPWNHTFGGNHNFGMTLYNGGSLYIDDGNPTPQGIATSVANLKERRPTIYFNVPKGFEDLIPYFRNDAQLRNQFFSNLKMLFYAGAGMPQHVWEAWEELAVDTVGEKIMISSGLGSTETCPSALFSSEPGGFAGLLGVPVPGLEVKLVADGAKMEARYRGKNVFPGYWKQPELTAKVFDEEGFYRTGDALLFVDEMDPNKGMIFNGRIAEDFKLNTGTWVHVGGLRSQMIAAGRGLIQDVVITGHDSEFIAAIVFIGMDYGRKISGLGNHGSLQDLVAHPSLRQKLEEVLNEVALGSTGSATLIKRAMFADFYLSIDKGEITDKGSINQRLIIQNHPDAVEQLYAKHIGNNIIEVKK